jgi:hypothetical protein
LLGKKKHSKQLSLPGFSQNPAMNVKNSRKNREYFNKPSYDGKHLVLVHSTRAKNIERILPRETSINGENLPDAKSVVIMLTPQAKQEQAVARSVMEKSNHMWRNNVSHNK